jgi:hypothetical protein
VSDDPKPKAVDPQLLYGISLLGGLILAWPSLASAMRGNADIIAAGIRLLLSIAVVWTGGYLITTLIAGYARAIPSGEIDLEEHAPTRVANTAPSIDAQGALPAQHATDAA